MNEKHGFVISAGREASKDDDGNIIGERFIVRIEYPTGVPDDLKWNLTWDAIPIPVEICPIKTSGGEG